MSNLNGQIKIYPATEMLAVDMAELMKAAYLFQGRIQGCRISVNSSRDLVMTSGRMVILGRLGYFSGGTIPVPSVSNDTACSVYAVCELSDSDVQFYVTVLTASQYNTQLKPKIDAVTTEFFNRNNGTYAVKLGDCTVISGGKVSKFTSTNDIRSNWSVFDDRVKAAEKTAKDNHNSNVTRIGKLESSNTTNTSTIKTNTSEINTLKTRKVVTSARATSADAEGITIKANGTVSIYVVPGYTTLWPANSNGTAKEKQNYSLNETRANRALDQLTNDNEMFAGLIQFSTNNNDVIITGWNCITSTAKGTIKLRNLSSKEVKNVKVSGKALLLAAKALSRATKA